MAASAAWIPARAHLPNVDIALLLVLIVALSGLRGRRAPVLGGALGAGAGFAYFDTAPYEHFVISRQPDVVTLVVLVAVSLILGDLAVRLARQRPVPARRDMARIREVAALVASGAELVTVIGAVAEELGTLLGGASAEYRSGPPAAGAWVVNPEGVLTATGPDGHRRPAGPPASGRLAVDVPVRGMGSVIGHFEVVGVDVRDAVPPTLTVALTLVDQVGAALIAQAPESAATPMPDGPKPRPALRVVE